MGREYAKILVAQGRATEKKIVAVWRNAARWLVELLGVDPRQIASLMKNKYQSHNLLLKLK